MQKKQQYNARYVFFCLFSDEIQYMYSRTRPVTCYIFLHVCTSKKSKSTAEEIQGADEDVEKSQDQTDLDQDFDEGGDLPRDGLL